MLTNVRHLDLKNLENVKTAFEHVSLYVGLVIFTAAGAKIFQALEHPEEAQKLKILQNLTIIQRENFMNFILNGTWKNYVEPKKEIGDQLSDYELTVAQAAIGGIDMATKTPIFQWSYIQSVFFTSTILTTIGYGNIAPVTTAGRVFCILYAIVGIPFTLSVIADVGQIFATLISTLWTKYKPLLEPIAAKIVEYKKRSKERQREKAREEGQELDEEEEEDDDDDDELGSSTALTAALGTCFLFFFFSIGSAIFVFWEDWSFLQSFYFCFITMTTIGFGDVVPDLRAKEAIQMTEKTAYMLIVMIYILVGLAFTSTIIELVRRQYAESWRKMQELRAQIQAQIKLAATLKQMQDQAGKNNIEFEGLDMAADLDELKKNIAKLKKGKLGKGLLSDIEINDLDWYDQNRKVKAVTIFIYETSV